ncbi:hypothetical protein [Lichenibacterium ramalinae]|uniref:Uncharacterized protein n=1 Tax=Lichenibacterium ramalinae TaxID=2316527 RepID=A0A4Q2RHM2_9HYPH|nr:hypothetical protein [Lichenibacterium ramalinae]RYB07182.1 hypothetical protein D3272_03730 [Lichenibacterium ramalinae]
MFKIATVGSLVLWAGIAWCTVALGLALHRGPFAITPSALTGSLLCICLAGAVAGLWIGEEMRWARPSERRPRSGHL